LLNRLHDVASSIRGSIRAVKGNREPKWRRVFMSNERK
jgi:hypothetical protein